MSRQIPLTTGQLEEHARHLHFPEGEIRRGGKVRACCHCGWATTPRVTRERARQALFDEHGFTGGSDKRPAECGICGEKSPRWWQGYPWPWEVFRPLADPAGGEFYVCRDDKACHARYEAARDADRLKCGCYQSSVMAIGHYHPAPA